MRKHSRVEFSTEDTSRWMVSYADFTTVLLAVFITLFVVNTASAKKDKETIASLEHEKPKPMLVQLNEEATLTSEINKKFKQKISANQISVINIKGGIRLEISDSVLFDTGSASLSATSEETLLQVYASIYDKPYAIQIEGHTDSTPIHTAKFDSNWELSAIRATEVLKFFEDLGIKDSRLSAVGYGASRPISADDLSKNRRVSILIIKES